MAKLFTRAFPVIAADVAPSAGTTAWFAVAGLHFYCIGDTFQVGRFSRYSQAALNFHPFLVSRPDNFYLSRLRELNAFVSRTFFNKERSVLKQDGCVRIRGTFEFPKFSGATFFDDFVDTVVFVAT